MLDEPAPSRNQEMDREPKEGKQQGRQEGGCEIGTELNQYWVARRHALLVLAVDRKADVCTGPDVLRGSLPLRCHCHPHLIWRLRVVGGSADGADGAVQGQDDEILRAWIKSGHIVDRTDQLPDDLVRVDRERDPVSGT